MPGAPVSIGCNVILTPGVTGPPDSGVIITVLQSTVTASGQQLATVGSICQMINSFSGAPYPLPIGQPGASTGVTVEGQGLVRVGDQILSGSGMLAILGPPAAPFITDENAP